MMMMLLTVQPLACYPGSWSASATNLEENKTAAPKTTPWLPLWVKSGAAAATGLHCACSHQTHRTRETRTATPLRSLSLSKKRSHTGLPGRATRRSLALRARLECRKQDWVAPPGRQDPPPMTTPDNGPRDRVARKRNRIFPVPGRSRRGGRKQMRIRGRGHKRQQAILRTNLVPSTQRHSLWQQHWHWH